MNTGTGGWHLSSSADAAAQVAALWHRRNMVAHFAAAATVLGSSSALTADAIVIHTADVVEIYAKVQSTNAQADEPPSLGVGLALFLLPANRQDEVLGDLHELYVTRWLPKLGPRKANWCYAWHVILSSTILLRIFGGLSCLGGLWRFFIH